MLSAQQDVPASGLGADTLPSPRHEHGADCCRVRADIVSPRPSSAPTPASAGRLREAVPNVRDAESARRLRDGDAEARVGEESRVQGESRAGTGGASRLPSDVESAEVEAWLDEHPDFAKDYFMRSV